MNTVNNNNKMLMDNDAIVDVDLLVPAKLSKDVKHEIASVGEMTRKEAKMLVDSFYQAQRRRIETQNQIRSIVQCTDESSTAMTSILDWELQNAMIEEKGLKDALQVVSEASKVGRWLLEIKGIGPTIAAGLLAYLDTNGGRHYATHFLSYAGINDNNRPWLGAEKSRLIVNEVLDGRKTITDDDLILLSAKTKWKYKTLDEACTTRNADGSIKSRSKEKLIRQISKIPYNASLKTLCFKIGESFVKNGNRGSLYGQLIQERKAYETEKNLNGDYADQAAKALSEKNYGKDTDAYKWYSEGKLPPAHINRRAIRWGVKLFLCHVFEEMYRVQNDKVPEPFYVFSHLGHQDYINPEVPFDLVSGEEAKKGYSEERLAPVKKSAKKSTSKVEPKLVEEPVKKRGRPKGSVSKKVVKQTTLDIENPVKKKRGRPKGSKNKKKD